MTRIMIVAGEASGDVLASGLVRKLKHAYPHAIIEGIAGPHMIKAGCSPLFHTDELSVMGVFEVIKHLPRLWRIRQQLLQHLKQHPPDLYIGIDAPDFNLSIEERLKRQGILTVHYNSPTVWAWRRYRVKKIARAVDLMLVLFPFEKDFYQQFAMPAKYVGHPLADRIPLQIDQTSARQQLALPTDKKILAILPGSRSNELNYLAELFIAAAAWCYQRNPDLIFITPMVNERLKTQFESLLQQKAAHLPFQVKLGHSQEILAAADVVLLASGTATLEAMLYKKPMVVGYHVSAPSYCLAKWLIKTPYIALPNLLANKLLVPEFIQHEATPEKMGEAVMKFLHQPIDALHSLQKEFTQIHESLRCHTDQKAANAIMELMKEKYVISA